MDINERIDLFERLLGCCHPLYLWTYDSNLYLLKSSCPESHVLNNLFLTELKKRQPLEISNSEPMPFLLSNEAGITWSIVPFLDGGALVRLYVIGPLFLSDVSQQQLEQRLRESGYTTELTRGVIPLLRQLPVISISRAFEYTIMLYYCLTGEQIHVSDLRYLHDSRPESASKTSSATSHGTYEAEQQMLQMVREGNVQELASHMNKMAVTGTLGQLGNGDPLRHLINTVEVCATLFSRAAIEGGLPPETSYTLTDQYFQGFEACTTLAEVAALAKTMQEDFVQRVHRCRTSHLSKPIIRCCDYIDFHLEQEISLTELASLAGYTVYYLSRKFKTELGVSPAEYIRDKRLERAAKMLYASNEDIQTICSRLQFGSQSYFSETFRQKYGMTPSQYRQGRKEK